MKIVADAKATLTALPRKSYIGWLKLPVCVQHSIIAHVHELSRVNTL
jgi:hypothetical protein